MEDLTVRSDEGFWTLDRRRDALVITLTLVTGSVDAIGLLRLGGVFTSVMTGNMVFLGIAASEHSGSIALHTVSRLSCTSLEFSGGPYCRPRPDHEIHLWPRSIVNALAVEFIFIAVFAVCWEIVHGTPSPDFSYALLGLNAAALGIQSSAYCDLAWAGFRLPISPGR